MVYLETRLTAKIILRDVTENDLPTFYKQQLDPAANYMAAFTHKDPADKTAFDEHWKKVRTDPNIVIKSILVDGRVAGYVASWVDATWLSRPEVTYWIGREYWGKGIATRALSEFLNYQTARPIYARAAKDNAASLRVLEKCGFKLVGSALGYANARGVEVEEAHLKLG